MKNFHFDKAIYAISESAAVLAGAIADGAQLVQLRDKTASAKMITAKAKGIIALKARYDFTFIINDNPELALAVGADGVHVGQDFDTTAARRLIGEGLILGKTTHNLMQAQRALGEGADYISAGPVFATPTKPGRAPVGVEYVRQLASVKLPIPFVAIGGIALDNIDEIITAGARTIGIVRALSQTRAMLEKVKNL